MSFLNRSVKTAFILGAGLGTRLRPLTLETPKPMLPVAGRPMICHALDRVIEQGVERILINTHHCAEIYQKFFTNDHWKGVPLFFRHEPVLLETAGGIKNIEDLIMGDDLLIYNGDVLADFDLKPLINFHLQGTHEVTLGLRSDHQPRHVGWDSRTHWVRDIREQRAVEGLDYKLFTGIYLVRSSFLKRLTAGKIESVIPVFLRMMEDPASENQIQGFLVDDRSWMDLGTLEDYQKVKESGI